MTDYQIEFDEPTHIYRVNGDIKRSVTQTLKDCGIVNYDGLDPYYADRGTRVHTACSLEASGFLDWSSLADDIKLYVTTFASIVARLGLLYVSCDELCYDAEYGIAGQYDLKMKDPTGKVWLVELKTTTAPMWGGLQLASYQRMTECDDVMLIPLGDNGKIWVPAEDWQKNHDTIREIHAGTFDFASWKIDKKRRRMIRMKEAV